MHAYIDREQALKQNFQLDFISRSVSYVREATNASTRILASSTCCMKIIKRLSLFRLTGAF